jgi:hypothetical protein
VNRVRESDRGRLNTTLTQRQLELLALYASAPPGEKLVQFCERAGIHRDTWHQWRTRNADFAAELERIRQERLQVALEPLRDAVPLLVESLIKLATEGSIAALRTAGDWLGLTRQAIHSVQLAVDARGAGAQETEKSLDDLLAEHAEVRDLLNRHMPLAVLKRERDQLNAAIANREEEEPLSIVLPDDPNGDAQVAS